MAFFEIFTSNLEKIVFFVSTKHYIQYFSIDNFFAVFDNAYTIILITKLPKKMKMKELPKMNIHAYEIQPKKRLYFWR